MSTSAEGPETGYVRQADEGTGHEPGTAPGQSTAGSTTSGTATASTHRNRRSQLFFGLCDMRTATVVLDILNILFTLLVAIVLAVLFGLDKGSSYGAQSVFRTLFGALAVAGVSALGLHSAMNWSVDGMLVATAGIGCVLLFRLAKGEWIDVLVNGLLLYPHAVLTREMSEGIMTPETFEEEEYVAEGGREFVEMAHSYVSPANSMV